jgi:AcrR family transcriptional regulator
LAVPRPRAFDEDEVVAAATELFWQQGFQATSIDDLEMATGLSRSSLYAAFTTKSDLFADALRDYLQTFVDPRLGPLERADAGLQEIIGYFKDLARLFRDAEAQRGCLMINTIGESAGRDAELTRQGEEFLERVRAAFANALASSVRSEIMTRRDARERAAVLVSTMVGVWTVVRVDPARARALCLSTASRVSSWDGRAY